LFLYAIISVITLMTAPAAETMIRLGCAQKLNT